MHINISNLSEGIHEYKLSEQAEAIGLGNDFHGAVTSTVTLEKSVHQFLLKVNASAKGFFICDRCSNEFEETVEASFTSVYSWEQDETKNEDDDFFILRPDENIIDISESIREYLTLAVPLKLLCKKSECKIPEYNATEEHTIDPRWEKLKELTRK